MTLAGGESMNARRGKERGGRWRMGVGRRDTGKVSPHVERMRDGSTVAEHV